MYYLAITGLTLLFQAQSAFAQIRPTIKPPTKVGISESGILGIACLGLRWLFTFAIIFSIVLVLLAAIEYMRSSGDPGKVKDATNKIVFAAIGVAVAIAARTLPILVGSLLQASGGTTDIAAICR